MRIYLIYRTDDWDYDEYDSWVVCARNKKEALELVKWGDGLPKPDEIKVKKIGISVYKKARAILGSFNAG